MKFSIVTSFCNETEELINRVYDSIVNQTYSNFEWIITDDFSKDINTTIFVKSLPYRDSRIRYVDQKSKKEIWWNPQTYAVGDIIVVVDGDDITSKKTLEIYNYFYNKYPDVLCMTTEIKNFKSGQYSGSLYLNYENYNSHLHHVFDIKHDPDLIRNDVSDMLHHGYNRSWRNLPNIDFRDELDNRLIINDFIQLTRLEEIGKLLHIPRPLYVYNTRDDSISRRVDSDNDLTLATKDINESIFNRRKGRNIDTIKRIFEPIFIESNAFMDCGITNETSSKKLLFVTPHILSPFKQQLLNELYFDHNICYNLYDDDIDYCVVQFNSDDDYPNLFPIYENIRKYIGNKEVIIQLTYRDYKCDGDIFKKIVDFLYDKGHYISWFTYNNNYNHVKIY